MTTGRINQVATLDQRGSDAGPRCVRASRSVAPRPLYSTCVGIVFLSSFANPQVLLNFCALRFGMCLHVCLLPGQSKNRNLYTRTHKHGELQSRSDAVSTQSQVQARCAEKQIESSPGRWTGRNAQQSCLRHRAVLSQKYSGNTKQNKLRTNVVLLFSPIISEAPLCTNRAP